MKNPRVKRPKQYEKLIDLLKDKEIGVFDTLKAVLTFAAAYGYQQGVRESFTETSEPIPWTYFSEHEEQALAFAIALAETQDTKIFRESELEKVLNIFEEYACGGLAILNDKVDAINVMASIEDLLSEHETGVDLGGLLDDFT